MSFEREKKEQARDLVKELFELSANVIMEYDTSAHNIRRCMRYHGPLLAIFVQVLHSEYRNRSKFKYDLPE